jgi:hypothetical protein
MVVCIMVLNLSFIVLFSKRGQLSSMCLHHDTMLIASLLQYGSEISALSPRATVGSEHRKAIGAISVRLQGQ